MVPQARAVPTCVVVAVSAGWEVTPGELCHATQFMSGIMSPI